jgi:hypothetical protein
MTEQTKANQPDRPARPRPRRPDDFLLPAPKGHTPLVKPGSYVGVTTEVIKRSYRGARDYLVVYFDLFVSAHELGAGVPPVARGIPGFFNLVAGPSSNYAKLVRLIFPEIGQQRLPSSALIGKQLLVEVRTVEKDSDGQAQSDQWSKVWKVVGHA